jgi:hypothetical protein
MAKSLEEVLGYLPLTGVIQAIKTGIPSALPEAFWRIKKQVPGVSGRYTMVKGTRTVAPINAYGSPALRAPQKGIEVKDVKLLHAFGEIVFDPLVLQTLRNYDNYEMQNLGVQEVDRQQQEFRVRFDNLRVAAVHSMLTLGAIYFDAAGNLLPSSSGAVTTVDFKIAANNKNQLNGIIAASWATATTDIPLHIRNLKNRAAQLTGYPLKYAFYGANVPTYLTANNYVKDYLSRNPVFAQKFLEQSEIPDGLFGLTWVPASVGFYEDSGGTNRQFFGGDTVTFAPEIDSTVYELMEGSFMVPSSVAAAANAGAALNSLRTVYGMGAYAVPTDNPPTVILRAFDTFLPVWKVPDALFIADTTP